MSLQRVAPFMLTASLPTSPVLRGRAADVATLSAALADGQRLITLLGPPGVGKTSLAAAVAQQLAATWVDLAAVDTAAGVLRAIADAVGARANATVDVVATSLARAPMVLVLDNLEQLLGGDASAPTAVHIVETLLRAVPTLAIVATSRVRLSLVYEYVLEVRPLPTTTTTAHAFDNAAVALFCDRALAAGAHAPVRGQLGDIVALVQQLDGLPLAIELAAAWTRVLTPRDILQRLARGDDVTLGADTTTHRHRSLYEAIASSWTRLRTSEQQALAACARFDGPFTIAAAEQVIGAAVDSASSALDLVASVRDKSLLQFDGTHLRLLVSIRDFVRARVGAGDIDVDTEAIDRAFVAAMTAIAERFVAAHFLLNAEADPDIHVVAPKEHQHLLTALALCSPASPSTWRSRALLLIATHELRSTPLPLLDALTAHIQMPHDESSAAAVVDDETLRLVLLLCAQSAAVTLSRFPDAAACEALFEQRVSARPGMLAYARLRAGIIARTAGDVDAAERCHAEVARVLSASPNSFTRLQGVNRACQGRLCCDRGDVSAAWEANTAAASLCDSVGERWLAALARANLAQLECERGRYDAAAELLERALEHLQASAERKYIAIYAAIYAGVCLERDAIDDATHWLRLAHQAFDPTGEPLIAVEVYGLSAVVAATTGDRQAAHAAVLRAREAAARLGSPITARIVACVEGVVAVSAADDAHVDDVVARWQREVAHLGVADLALHGPPWPLALQHLDVRAARRLLLQALARRGVPVGIPIAPPSGALLRVGPDALWFVVDDRREDLGRKGAMRRILHALLAAHATQPGVAVTADALVLSGWPGERVLPEAASTRLRTAISSLRKLGLRDIIQTRDDGYLIAATAIVETDGAHA